LIANQGALGVLARGQVLIEVHPEALHSGFETVHVQSLLFSVALLSRIARRFRRLPLPIWLGWALLVAAVVGGVGAQA